MPQFPATVIHELQPWLSKGLKGDVFLTSNGRSARWLTSRINATAERSRGDNREQGWASPTVLDWSSWIKECWRELTWRISEPQIMLSAMQERMQWERVIAANSDVSPLNLEPLSRLAQQAWTLLYSYGDGLATLERYSAPTLDCKMFRQWAQRFSAVCAGQAWTTQAQMEAGLADAVSRGAWSAPDRVVLWGMDSMTPSQERLVAAMASRATVENIAPSVKRVGAAARVLAESAEQEFQMAAQWAHDHLGRNPAAQLAIVTTRAAMDRGPLSRALAGTPVNYSSFSFSAGWPLAQYPLAHTALALLRWSGEALPSSDISSLLAARELAISEADQFERAAFDTNVFCSRNMPDARMTLWQFRDWLGGELGRRENPSLRMLHRQCRAACEVMPQRLPQLSAEDWAGRFRKVLSSFGLPSPLSSTSQEFQIWQATLRLLDEFASLSLEGETFGLDTALRRLESMAVEREFQPKSHDAQIEVLGPLEAAGSLFDGIFFLGCSEDRWPLPATTNPLLSLELQRGCMMPGAVRGAGLERARAMTERLLRSAPDAVFSCPTQNETGEVRPSSLLLNDRFEPRAMPQSDVAPYASPVEWEEFEDAPVLWSGDRGKLSSSVIQWQAACPFKSFAIQRLGARNSAPAEDGLDAGARGTFLHRILQAVWLGEPDGLRNHRNLMAKITAGELQSYVHAKANSLLADFAKQGWQQELLVMEAERDANLVVRWLTEVEALRKPFTVVAVEHREEFTLLETLHFRVRLDRIDAIGAGDHADRAIDSMAEGETLLLDYKTGKLDGKAWQTPNMDEPQLPLYALFAMPSPPAAVAIGNLRADSGPSIFGLKTEADLWPGEEASCLTQEEYSGRQQEWQNDILQLAQDFRNGIAVVQPKRGSDTCQHCGLQSLCRTYELAMDTEEESEEAAGTDNA